MSNRTEVTPAQAETPTPVYQHLAPALPAQSAGKPGEEMVMAMVPRKFEITLSDGSRQRVVFEPGNYPIPKRFKGHYYLAANGVSFGDDVMLAAKKPRLEDGADPAAAAAAAEAAALVATSDKAKAFPTDDELEKAKFDDLALILKTAGLSDDEIKALGSKDARRAKISELRTAAEAAAAETKAQA